MIIVSNVLKMVLHSSKCVYAICGTAMVQSASVFMRAVLKIRHLKQHLRIWKSRNVNGWHTMVSSQIFNSKLLLDESIVSAADQMVGGCAHILPSLL